MLRRLFKSRHRLSHPDATERRNAILALDGEAAGALLEDLARLVREDPDLEVRLACIERMPRPEVLEPLLNDPHLGQAAARRLLALNPGGPAQPAATPQRLQAELMTLPTEEALERLAAVDDVDALIDLALKARGELREGVLHHSVLSSATGLTALEKRTRDRDKTLNRHARRRLDLRKSLQHEAAALRQRAGELAEALRRRDPPAQDHAWRERQHELYRRLEDALNSHAEVRSRLAAFGDHLPDLEALRHDPAELPALEPEPAGAAPSEAPVATAHDPFDALVSEFRALDHDLTRGGDFPALAARRQALTERWLTAADHQPPADAQHQVFEAVSHRFRELADAVERMAQAGVPTLPDAPLSWPADGPPPADVWPALEQRRALAAQLDRAIRSIRWPDWAPPAAGYQALQDVALRLREDLAQADRVLHGEIEALEEQLARLRQAIDEGHLQEAQSLLGKARTRHDALPDSATRRLSPALGKEAARLAELKDWQTFATSPKRASLVEAMAHLATQPLAPRDQADRIKALRQEWQSLGPVTRAADGRLADRFNAEAERAFEPCRAYFAELAEQRKANLAQRQRICDQLEHYLKDTDWARADMKAAERIMRAARDEWRAYHPVDRNPGKAVEARFEALQEQLHDRVKAEWDRNLQAKRALVEEAAAVAEADLPMRDKVESAKTLQRRWREVGITPRRPDQQLWREFRAACDRIFSARDDARSAHDRDLAELEGRLSSELDALEARLTGLTPRDAAESDLRELRQRTADVDRLPPNRRRHLAERRHDLVERFQQLLGERRRLDARDRLAAFEQWDADATRAEAAGAELPPLPPGLAADVARDRAASRACEVPAETLRRLTVRAELAAGRESADTDQALRMQVQVERLQAGLGGGAPPENAASLAGDWCRLGPKDEAAAPLRTRFFAALAHLD